MMEVDIGDWGAVALTTWFRLPAETNLIGSIISRS
jgi:hypothetical protein